MSDPDKYWTETMAEIESLRFQLINNIMPPSERKELQHKLMIKLIDLAKWIRSDEWR